MEWNTCRNLPFGGRATRDSRDACSTKGIRAESPPTFIWGKRRKNRKRRDLRTLNEKVRELYLRTGKVLAPHTSVIRDGSLQMCKHDFDFYVPFYVLISFIPFLYFSLFCGRQGCFPLLLRIPQLWWGNQTHVVLSEQSVWVKLFLSFLHDMFLLNEKPFKALDH